jgi:hypothetical protein
MYYHKLYVDVSIQREKLKSDALSGMNYFLCSPAILTINEEKKLQLFGDDNCNIELSRKKWGVFDLIVSKSAWQKHSYSLIAITGESFTEADRVALYLADRGKPLGVCGKTRLRGACYLPKAGVENVYIEGKNFTGNKIVEGTTRVSEKKLPVFNDIKEYYMIVKDRKYFSETDSMIDFDNLMRDTIINSFLSKTQVLYSKNEIILNERFFKGNIKVISEKSVKISKSNELKDIIVIAPYINFAEEFKGQLQAYACDSLSINDKVELDYPSVLGVLVTRTDTIQSYLLIKQKAKVAGLVFLYSEATPKVLKPYIKINKEALICGQLISSNDIQLQGTVNGSVYCNRFILKTASSYYENDLLDAVIDFTKLPKEFVGLSSCDSSKTKKIVKWLF